MVLKETKTYYNPINGEYASILKTSDTTDGEYSFLEVSLKSGGGNPLHYHTRFSEEFHAVKGNLGVVYNKKKLYLKPREHFLVPPYHIHRFFNDSNEEIIFRVRLIKGQPDFGNFIKVLFGLVRDGKTFSKNQIPRNPFHAAILYKWGDTHPTSPFFKVLKPFANITYSIAQKLGIDKKLIAQYCS